MVKVIQESKICWCDEDLNRIMDVFSEEKTCKFLRKPHQRNIILFLSIHAPIYLCMQWEHCLSTHPCARHWGAQRSNILSACSQFQEEHRPTHRESVSTCFENTIQAQRERSLWVEVIQMSLKTWSAALGRKGSIWIRGKEDIPDRVMWVKAQSWEHTECLKDNEVDH